MTRPDDPAASSPRDGARDPLADPAATAERLPHLPHAPATARNRAPIAAELDRLFAGRDTVRVLEIAGGTGEHGLWFCRCLPSLIWQSTDRDAETVAGIAAWRALCPDLHARHKPPRRLDAAALPWEIATSDRADAGEAAGRDGPFDAVFTANLTHISPWPATEGLMAGAAGLLTAGGLLIVYGPFHEGGRPTGPGNARFDAGLKARDPSWGLRDRAAVVACAERAGFRHRETVTMPADNRLLVLERV